MTPSLSYNSLMILLCYDKAEIIASLADSVPQLAPHVIPIHRVEMKVWSWVALVN